ncbi:MAG: hypothetical protein SNJ64_05240, partial [Endomicrobiia bacterium]
MKPLLISSHDTGGAAKACIRLHEALLNENIESFLQVRFKTNNNIKNCFQYENFKLKYQLGKALYKINSFLKERKIIISGNDKFLKNRNKELSRFSFPCSNIDLTRNIKFKEADIINLHWVAEYIDYSSFFKKTNKPVVWTLHDMNPFSGGEHYIEHFLGIDNDGYPQKRKYTDIELKIIEKNLLIKQKALQNFEKLYIVSPSTWLAKESQNSQLFRKYPHIVIPNSLNINIFKP